MSEDLSDEELADLHRRQAVRREEQRQLDLYEEEFMERQRTDEYQEMIYTIIEQEQRGQGA